MIKKKRDELTNVREELVGKIRDFENILRTFICIHSDVNKRKII